MVSPALRPRPAAALSGATSTIFTPAPSSAGATRRPRAASAAAAFSPQKRLIEPDEVAALAVLLASDEARGVTAQAWNVDGGAVQA